MGTLSEYSRLAELQEAHRRALKQLERLRNSKEDVIEATRQAVHDAVLSLEYAPVDLPTVIAKPGTPETAIVLLSDWQLAKLTPSYNSVICEQRIEHMAEQVMKLTRMQRTNHPVPNLRVYLLGDIVEGELIFPGQASRIDASLYRQVVADGPRILGNFLRRMLSFFEDVHVVGVIGNHGAIGGRSRRDFHPETNADSMLYEVTQLSLQAEDRLTWAPNYTPGERHWYAVDQVGNKSFLLFHGDQIRGGFAGFPWYGLGKKIYGWNAGAIEEHFDYAVLGHWHQPVSVVLNDKMAWVNGSTESHNTYAQEELASVGKPSQWLLFCHPENGVTAEYRVWL